MRKWQNTNNINNYYLEVMATIKVTAKSSVSSQSEGNFPNSVGKIKTGNVYMEPIAITCNHHNGVNNDPAVLPHPGTFSGRQQPALR
ncbi:hypothetical protein CB1_000210001 [Camelus ferus]|nr:hypothetical protein CB1_000210001 [Camelus ferus]